MPIPSDGRIPWPSTAASIPSGWTRDTDFDDRYFQGDDNLFAGAANGGNETHKHDPDEHEHQMASSGTHDVSGSRVTGGTVSADPTPNEAYAVDETHNHVAVESSGADNDFVSSVAPTVNPATSQPPSVRMIMLKPDDANQLIPDDGIAFLDRSNVPTGFTKTSGYEDKFIIGALMDGDGGGTLGSTVHVHTTEHEHDLDDHEHSTPFLSGGQSAMGFNWNISLGSTGRPGEHHNLTLDSVNIGTSDTDETDTGAGLSSPLYQDVLAVQNTSGSAALETGLIIPFVGAIGSIPADWELCTNLLNTQLRITETDGNIGNIGGANEQAHVVGITHNHLFGAHNHPVTVSLSGVLQGTFGGTSYLNTAAHGPHTWTVSSETHLTTSQQWVTNSVDIRYKYRTVIFIRYEPTTVHILGKTHILGNTHIL